MVYSSELFRGVRIEMLRGATGLMGTFCRGGKGAVVGCESDEQEGSGSPGLGPGDVEGLVRGGESGKLRGPYIPCSARNLARSCKARWRPASAS